MTFGRKGNKAMNLDGNVNEKIIKEKIRRALLSGPESVTRAATVAELGLKAK